MTASLGDLRPTIEGRLTEAGRNPLRTQVVLHEAENGTHMNLHDECSWRLSPRHQMIRLKKTLWRVRETTQTLTQL